MSAETYPRGIAAARAADAPSLQSRRGVAILLVMKAVGKADWLARAAQIVAEKEDTLHQRPL